MRRKGMHSPGHPAQEAGQADGGSEDDDFPVRTGRTFEKNKNFSDCA